MDPYRAPSTADGSSTSFALSSSDNDGSFEQMRRGVMAPTVVMNEGRPESMIVPGRGSLREGSPARGSPRKDGRTDQPYEREAMAIRTTVQVPALPVTQGRYAPASSQSSTCMQWRIASAATTPASSVRSFCSSSPQRVRSTSASPSPHAPRVSAAEALARKGITM